MNQSQPQQPISTAEEYEQAAKRLAELQKTSPQAGTDQERELRELRERVETWRRANPDEGSQGTQRR